MQEQVERGTRSVANWGWGGGGGGGWRAISCHLAADRFHFSLRRFSFFLLLSFFPSN